MSTAVAPLVQQVVERARTEPGFADVLEAVLKAPTGPDGTLERVAAHSLNEERRSALVHEFVEGSLATPKVQQRLAVRSPQAVHRLRSRGKLLGSAVGNQTYFPAWQFDADRVRTDPPRLLDLLSAFTSDPLAADRIMRLTHDELGGSSIAEALRRPKTADVAWRMLAALRARPFGRLPEAATRRPTRRSAPSPCRRRHRTVAGRGGFAR